MLTDLSQPLFWQALVKRRLYVGNVKLPTEVTPDKRVLQNKALAWKNPDERTKQNNDWLLLKVALNGSLLAERSGYSEVLAWLKIYRFIELLLLNDLSQPLGQQASM